MILPRLLLLMACGVATGDRPSSSPAQATSSDPVLAAMASRPLVETRHGRCRMACRHIDRDEVEGILRTGRIQPERTRHDGECPSYAVEGQTRDGQAARVVFAACPSETRVVTAIDLDTDWPCSCP